MQKEISKEQFWEIYETLPVELQDAIFSGKTAEIIFNACVDNGVEDERISKVAGYVGDILLGLLAPEQLQPSLELDLDLEPKAAENISQTVYGSILEPVRDQLAKLHFSKGKKEIEASEEKTETETAAEKETETEINPEEQIKDLRREKTAAGKAATNKSSSDSYREPIGG
jgi:hypothetical protein